MKPLIIHEEALSELDDAIDYYEKESPGLGLDLEASVREGLANIQRNPGLYPRHKKTSIQRCVVRRFPYVIFYADFDDHISIIAISHTKRRPDYWRRRTRP
jgi:toxin ParE1/3/4